MQQERDDSREKRNTKEMFKREILERLLNGENLGASESEDLMNCIMHGELTHSQTAAILAALRSKGETVEEITGFARAMRMNAARVNPRKNRLVDTCGTGGDGTHTFNISTAVAIIASSLGIPVAKHGNRAVSSKCGSADVLEELGISIDLPPASVAALIDEIGIGFLFAPNHHPSMKHAAQVRRELGVRTIFNILGPLANPLGVKRQLIGVFKPELTEMVAKVLKALGSVRVYAVHGRDGTDEVSITSETVISVLENGSIRTFTFTPEEAGFKRAKLEMIKGGSSSKNASLIESILRGERGPHRDVVVLNCAFAALVAEKVDSIIDGVRLAAEAIDSKEALKQLERFREASERLARMKANGRG